MRIVERDEVERRLRWHAAWLAGARWGVRLDAAGMDLTHAQMSHATLTGALFGGAALPDDGTPVPVVEGVDAAILSAVRAGGVLDMAEFHGCATTHCRAGWAVHLAGAAGRALEERWETPLAAALIYAASSPGEAVPDFYCTAGAAMADMRDRAARAAGGRP